MSFDNSITSLITYHTLSMESNFMISQKIHMMTNYNSQLHKRVHKGNRENGRF